MSRTTVRSEAVEVLHEMHGRLEVARDIVSRSRSIYVDKLGFPESPAAECIAHAADLLGRAVAVLEAQLSARVVSDSPAA